MELPPSLASSRPPPVGAPAAALRSGLLLGGGSALVGFTPLGFDEKVQEIAIDFVLFAAISLLCQSLFLTSIGLLMPWQSDGTLPVGGAISTVDLPAEYFVMLPLNGHRRLFGEFGASDAPDADRADSIFLRPFDRADVRKRATTPHARARLSSTRMRARGAAA